MRKGSDKVLLPIPKWQIGTLLFTSLAIFIATAGFETYLGDLSLWFFVGSFILFIPAYVILYRDIADRPISHLWASALLIIPIVTPFVYLAMRDQLKAEKPELI